MSLLLVLNELSYRQVKARREEVSDSLHDLVRLLRRIRQHRTDVALVTETGFLDLTLADGYSVREWAGNGRNRDLLRVFLSMRNRAPFRDVIPAGLGDDADHLHEDRSAEGLGTAFLVGGLGISLRLAEVWNSAWLRLTQRALAEDDAGDVVLTSAAVDVRHACAPDHVDEHQLWLVESELNRLHTAAALWEAREDIFPHLRFLQRVADDLAELPPYWFNPVKERLAELEATAAAWHAAVSPTPSWRSKVTPESDSRRELCRFTDIDGVSHLFELHARFTPGPGRLHFRLDSVGHTLIIAYVGRKLF